MNYKKIILKTTLWVSGITLLLFIVLCVHIYMVSGSKKNVPTMQLSRIDFKQAIDSAEAQKIKSFIRRQEDVQAAYFNVKDGILVYTYQLGKQNSANIYQKLMDFGHYKAERYIVDDHAAQSGCPVMDKNSFSYKLAYYMAKFFNDQL